MTKKYERIKRIRKENREWLLQSRGSKCERCGYDKCSYALEFHHRNPEEKEFPISGFRTMNRKRLKAEADKCDLLCANCHREIEYCI